MHSRTDKRRPASPHGRSRQDRARFTHKNYDNRACLFIKSLRPHATVSAVRELFEEYGPVNYVVLKDKVLQAREGPVDAKFGFINFESEQSAHIAVREAKFRPEILQLINNQIAKNADFLFYYQDKESRPDPRSSVQKPFGRKRNQQLGDSRVFSEIRKADLYPGHVLTEQRYDRSAGSGPQFSQNPRPPRAGYFDGPHDSEEGVLEQAPFDPLEPTAVHDRFSSSGPLCGFPDDPPTQQPGSRFSARGLPPPKAFELFPKADPTRTSRRPPHCEQSRAFCGFSGLGAPQQAQALPAQPAQAAWLLHDRERFAALPAGQQLDILKKTISKKLVGLLQDISILPMVMDIITGAAGQDASHLYRCAVDEQTLLKQVNLAYALLGEEVYEDAYLDSDP